MGDPKYFQVDALTPKEKHRALRALSRIKAQATESGELTFMLFAFKGSKMIYSESPKMACTQE